MIKRKRRRGRMDKDVWEKNQLNDDAGYELQLSLELIYICN